MNNAIKIVIKKFDDIDYFSENNSQKDFFLSMTKYPTFKKKLTRLIDYYNEFAKKYNSLNEVDESDKSYIIKRFSALRNSIHDNEIQISAEYGTLCIFDLETNEEVPNNTKHNKKAIVGSAFESYGEKVDKNDTLYQRYHRLTKKILGK